MVSLAGSIVAVVTPMLENGGVDYESLARLIEWHIAEGTHGLCVVGTTGESAMLSVEEHIDVCAFAVRQVASRVPVIAGAGANSTSEAIELTALAKKIGADAALHIAPYYVRPTQEGMFQHFRAVAQAVDLPIVLYNVPARTGVDIGLELTLKLACEPSIIGIKDATGSIERASEILRYRPSGFSLYSGDDPTAAALMLLGGEGTISVTANVAPHLMAQLCERALAGEAKAASALNLQLMPLHQALFIESSPSPTKWALGELGLIKPHCRLPLVPLSEKARPVLASAMRDAGIVKVNHIT
ncbi:MULTISPECIES: 4-hydroxy-tetrahydrodipicolinate synthase [Pseudomonas]|uniref:4-hydroxy-tetrahydrodipicolinate synthase n=2 Tax=Pseudomonas TaxID=286 RepID=A0A0W0HCR3_PSEFL|nr:MULTISPECIES: 4-hydroxy-tetrahydrodipicolinate synthase [Pseudomonas]KTB58605.1 4-hydroxy-tetrahydrodipicolinate synthase [Pseudomonas fluorescens ICMP 11288]RMQ81933.1 hypothetical protein ALP97_200185 [Pseudomonas salomonii]